VNRTVFQDSASYWEQRYTNGGDSGVGSFGCFARFKADVINDFVARHPVHTVIEFGCGDGNQLSLAEYPTYIGYDISTTAIEKCISKFLADHTKSFRLLSEYVFEKADLVLSLDVIYHLVEDEVFETYMQTIFGASYQYVIIYSSNFDDIGFSDGNHIKHRQFTQWIAKNLQQWTLLQHIPNRHPYAGDYKKGSFSEFFIYVKR
jgi:hypothetical protein